MPATLVAHRHWISVANHIAAYADDYAEWTAGLVYDVILDKFYEMIEPFAQHVPYMMSPGNHV